MKLEVDAREAYECYPNLVVLVTSVGGEGVANVMTCCWAVQFGWEPPLFGLVMRPERYTYELIRETGEFVVNVPTRELEDAVMFCGGNSGRDVDKWAGTVLTPVPAQTVSPPWVEECVMHMECQVVDMRRYGERVLVVGRVKTIYKDAERYGRGNLVPH